MMLDDGREGAAHVYVNLPVTKRDHLVDEQGKIVVFAGYDLRY